MNNHPTHLPRAVLFDWDNTLIDSWGIIHASLAATFRQMGHEPWTLDETMRRTRLSLRDSFPALFGDRWTEARDAYLAYFAAHHIAYLTPLPGAEALVRAFAARGVYLGVVSNKTGRFLRAEAEALGWAPLFGALVGAGDAGADKPDLAPVLMALNPAAIMPGPEVWFIGDADIDMQCAHAADCLPVLIASSPENEEFSLYPPRFQFSCCTALAELVSLLPSPP